MSRANTTTASVAITERFAPGFVEAVWRNDILLRVLRLMGAFGSDRELFGAEAYDTNHRWHVNSSGNSSVGTFVQGDPALTSGNQSWTRPVLPHVYHWGFYSIEGILIDALANGGNFPAGMVSEQRLLTKDIANARNDTYLGSGTNGIQTAVSSTATYAGITRGSAAYFESTEVTTSAAQTVATHKSITRSMRDAEKGGLLTLNLTSPTQADTYSSLVGSATTVNFPQLNAMLGSLQGPGSFDMGVRVNEQTLSKAPIIEIPDMASTIWLYLDTTEDAEWFHDVPRPFNTEWYANEGDAKKFKTTIGSNLGVQNPKLCAKRTGLT